MWSGTAIGLAISWSGLGGQCRHIFYVYICIIYYNILILHLVLSHRVIYYIDGVFGMDPARMWMVSPLVEWNGGSIARRHGEPRNSRARCRRGIIPSGCEALWLNRNFHLCMFVGDGSNDVKRISSRVFRPPDLNMHTFPLHFRSDFGVEVIRLIN